MKLTPHDIAKMLDHSTLQPFLTDDDIRKGCELALHYDTASVCARPCDMPLVAWLVGLCFVAFAIFEIVTAVKAKGFGVPMWGWPLFSGVLNALCGIAFFVWPEMLSVFLAMILLVRAASLIVYGWNAGRYIAP